MKFKASWSIEIEADSNAEALVKAMTIGNRSTKEPIRTTLSVLPIQEENDKAE